MLLIQSLGFESYGTLSMFPVFNCRNLIDVKFRLRQGYGVMSYLTGNSFNRLVEYGFLRNTYLFHRCGLGMGLIKAPIPFPYHSFAWQSSHTIPIARIIPIYGKGMDFYEIRIFPIDKTIERQNMASYGFDMVGKIPYQNHMKSIHGP